MMKLIKNNKKAQLSLIIVSFIVISLLQTVILIKNHEYTIMNDCLYHINQITGITKAIKQGIWLPHFDFWMFNQNGSAVDTFYPYITIWPIAFLYTMIRKTITSWFIILTILIFIGMLISFFSSKNVLSRNKRWLFTIIYGTAGSVMNSAIYKTDTGEFMALIFLPIVFFGFLKLLKYSQWKQLSLGFALIAYSHILSTIIVFIFIAILALLNIKKLICKDKIKAIIKAIISTILVTSFQTVPMVYIMTKNSIWYPKVVFNPNNTTMFINPKYYLIFTGGLISIVGLIMGVLYYKKETRIAKQLSIISIILFVLLIMVKPWVLFSFTWLNYLQIPEEPDRLLMLLELCVSYLIVINISKHNRVKIPELVLIIMLSIGMPLYKQDKYVNLINKSNPKSRIESTLTTKNQLTGRYSKEAYVNKNNQLKYLINSRYECYRAPDYYAKSNKNRLLKLQHSNLNGIKFENKHNGNFKFKTNKYKEHLEIPVNAYNGVKYDVKLNHKSIPYSSLHHLVDIHNIRPGKYQISVTNKQSIIYIIPEIVSLASLLIFIKKRKKNTK